MKLSEIDVLRSEAAKIALASHPEGEPPENYEALRDELEVVEREIWRRFKIYWAQPDCPFCRHRYGWATAKLVDSKTQGRLECERCGAQALVGHCAAKRWDE